MRKIISAVVVLSSIFCLTGCESPEERNHRLDVDGVGYSESENSGEHTTEILYATVDGELFEITSYRTYVKNDSVLLYLKNDYCFRDDDGNYVSCKEIVTSLNNVFIFQKCEKKQEQ